MPAEMALAHALLATLLGGPASGYRLAKRFDRSVGYFWQATHQQIYRELVALERQGYVEPASDPAPSPEKRYRLTPLGQEHLADWIAQPTEPGGLREDLLVKVRAGALVPAEVIVAELRRRCALHAEKLALYQTVQERDFPDPEHLTYEQRFLFLPLLRGIMFEADDVAWCEAALALIETQTGAL
jgi:DNA-binding PadR family transcriptional regulator